MARRDWREAGVRVAVHASGAVAVYYSGGVDYWLGRDGVWRRRDFGRVPTRALSRRWCGWHRTEAEVVRLLDNNPNPVPWEATP